MSVRSKLPSGTDLRGVKLGRCASIAVATVGTLCAIGLLGTLLPGSIFGTLLEVIFAKGTVGSALRRSTPIVLAALGGIFAEKSGVINIGLEGLLIVAAFAAVYAMELSNNLWIAFLVAVLVSTVFAGLFAVVCIEFRADQIIAGLAVWLIALGLAPFASQVVYGAPNTDSVRSPPGMNEVLTGLPVVGTVVSVGGGAVGDVLTAVADLPVVGGLFHASVVVVVGALVEADVAIYLMFLMVGASWYLLYRTRFGRWVRASGENPKALDTAGVNVSRVRYASVLLSGVFCGMGGAALSLGLGQFTGNGQTMVNGKGFIAIVAYLFGNYNPVGAFFATLLFGGLDAIQTGLQNVDIGVPSPLVRIIPFVVVIIVLALAGRTRVPSAGGEHYESGEE